MNKGNFELYIKKLIKEQIEYKSNAMLGNLMKSIYEGDTENSHTVFSSLVKFYKSRNEDPDTLLDEIYSTILREKQFTDAVRAVRFFMRLTKNKKPKDPNIIEALRKLLKSVE
jgi:transcription elongation factor GreA-like protein